MRRIPRFAVEAPLGRLATRLRLLGFDTTYQKNGDAAGFFAQAPVDRVALIRTRRLKGRLPQKRWHFIRDNDPEAQLIEVLAAFELGSDHVRPFRRCVRCNRLVEELDHEAARGRVPDFVWMNQASFTVCPQCGQVFWPGSHARRFQDQINHWIKRSHISGHDKS